MAAASGASAASTAAAAAPQGSDPSSITVTVDASTGGPGAKAAASAAKRKPGSAGRGRGHARGTPSPSDNNFTMLLGPRGDVQVSVVVLRHQGDNGRHPKDHKLHYYQARIRNSYPQKHIWSGWAVRARWRTRFVRLPRTGASVDRSCFVAHPSGRLTLHGGGGGPSVGMQTKEVVQSQVEALYADKAANANVKLAAAAAGGSRSRASAPASAPTAAVSKAPVAENSNAAPASAATHRPKRVTRPPPKPPVQRTSVSTASKRTAPKRGSASAAAAMATASPPTASTQKAAVPVPAPAFPLRAPLKKREWTEPLTVSSNLFGAP